MNARRRDDHQPQGSQHRQGGGNPGQRSGGRRRSRGGRGRGSAGGGADQRTRQDGGNRAGGNRRGRKRRKPSPAGYWGDPRRLPEPTADVRITDDPAAVPRSLGPPPLPGHEQIAAHYFRAVYDRAVSTAGALAAAGGLIDPGALVGGDEDQD